MNKKDTKEEQDIKEIKEDLEEIKEGLKEERQEVDYLLHLQRLQAEFINYRNRVEIEKCNSINNGKEQVILKVLDVVDNFERALEHNKDKGVEMIYNQLITILKQEEVGETPYEDFNPLFHEALCKIPSDAKENTILEVIQKGYLFKNKLLRPAKVNLAGGKK